MLRMRSDLQVGQFRAQRHEASQIAVQCLCPLEFACCVRESRAEPSLTTAEIALGILHASYTCVVHTVALPLGYSHIGPMGHNHTEV